MSEVKVDKISPRSGTDVTLGDASDTFTLPASATIQVASSGEIDIASGATLDVNGTLDVTGATVTGLSAGKVLQVVNQVYENAEINFSSTSFVDLGTNTDITITPSSTSNKILYLANVGFRAGGSETSAYGSIKIVRDDTTDLGAELFLGRHMYSGSFAQYGSGSFMYLDSPSTTSAITYSMYGKKSSGAVFHLSVGSTNHVLSVIAMEIET